jgi:hypothetical protein
VKVYWGDVFVDLKSMEYATAAVHHIEDKIWGSFVACVEDSEPAFIGV